MSEKEKLIINDNDILTEKERKELIEYFRDVVGLEEGRLIIREA